VPSDQRAALAEIARKVAAGLDPFAQGRYRCSAHGPHSKNVIMLAQLHAFAEWLATTAMSNTIQNVTWIIPTVQTVHIVCVALVISAVFLVDLRILGVFARAQPVAALSQRFLPWIWYVILVLLVTGTLLIIGEPTRSVTNPAFALKMAMLITVSALTLVIERPLRRDPRYWEASGGRRATVVSLAVVSLLLWSGIVFAGRWIAYISSY
jgi:uncharacterized protein DUF6644